MKKILCVIAMLALVALFGACTKTTTVVTNADGTTTSSSATMASSEVVSIVKLFSKEAGIACRYALKLIKDGTIRDDIELAATGLCSISVTDSTVASSTTEITAKLQTVWSGFASMGDVGATAVNALNTLWEYLEDKISGSNVHASVAVVYLNTFTNAFCAGYNGATTSACVHPTQWWVDKFPRLPWIGYPRLA